MIPLDTTPHGSLIHEVFLPTPYLDDHEITGLIHRTWTCANCGHAEHDTSPAHLRAKARNHAQQHVAVQV